MRIGKEERSDKLMIEVFKFVNFLKLIIIKINMLKNIIVAAVAILVVDQTQAVQIKSEQRAKMDQAVQSYLNAESGSKAEWGFLKNIVNIDRFFDSGVKA